MQIRRLPIASIWPDAGQPRRDFDQQALSDLAESVRAVGIRQPIHVAPDGDGWQIRDGERRWRAAQLAGLTALPCLVQEAEGWLATRQHQIVTNALQEPLTPLEDAQALYALWLGYQVEALEIAQEGPSEAFYAALQQLVRPLDQIALLEQRLCHLAGVPVIAAYLASGKVAVSWQVVLEACGRSDWAADRRKKHLAVLKVDRQVQELLVGAEVSARTLRELAAREAYEQRKLVNVVLAEPLNETGNALRAALERSAADAGPVFYEREAAAIESATRSAAVVATVPTGWPDSTITKIEESLLKILTEIDRCGDFPTAAQLARLTPLVYEVQAHLTES